MNWTDRHPVLTPLRFKVSGCQRYPRDECTEIKAGAKPFLAAAVGIIAAEVLSGNLADEGIDAYQHYKIELTQHDASPERYSWGINLSGRRGTQSLHALEDKLASTPAILSRLACVLPIAAAARRAPWAEFLYLVSLRDLSNHQRLSLQALHIETQASVASLD